MGASSQPKPVQPHMQSAVGKTEDKRVGSTSKRQELQVLDAELSSLRKGRRVYVQQHNSQVFFLDQLPQVHSSVKKQLAELTRSQK